MFDFDYESDLKIILQIFFSAVQKSIPDFSVNNNWEGFAHALTFKFYRHIYSIRSLALTKSDIVTGDRFVDVASLKVLERAMFENFLVFHHIFCADDKELGGLRFDIWQVCGLMARQKFDPGTTEFDVQIEQERKTISRLWYDIKRSPCYEMLYGAKQRKRLENGEWTGINKMDKLAKEAKVEFYYKKMYGLTSGYGHTGYLSALQVNQARSRSDQFDIIQSTLGMTLTVATNFLVAFARLSPLAQSVLDQDENFIRIHAAYHIEDNDWEAAMTKNGKN